MIEKLQEDVLAGGRRYKIYDRPPFIVSGLDIKSMQVHGHYSACAPCKISLSELLMEKAIVVPQTHDISRDEEFIRLIKEGRIHEDDILTNRNGQGLVIAVAPEAYFPILEVVRNGEMENPPIEWIAYRGYRVFDNGQQIRSKLIDEIRSSKEKSEFAFYDAKLKEMGL